MYNVSQNVIQIQLRTPPGGHPFFLARVSIILPLTGSFVGKMILFGELFLAKWV